MRNTRHSWSIKDGIIYYSCPSFLDKDGYEIELEDELTPRVECMICEEQIASERTLIYQIKRFVENKRREKREALRRGISQPAGICPERYAPAGDWWMNKK